MSLDAMEWVWEHARARGAARLVLLAIADRAAGPDCTAYAGTTMLVRRTGASRSSIVRAVDGLTASGELEIVRGAAGPRGETRYRLPHAAEYLRALAVPGTAGGSGVGGSFTPPVAGSGRRSSDSGGSDTPPEGSHGATGRGSETRPPHQSEHNHQGHSSAAARDTRTATIPDAARPLVTALAAAGIDLPWRLGPGEWSVVLAAEQRWGRDALVHVAVERTAGRAVRSARYLLAIWRDAANFSAGAHAAPAAAQSGATVVPLWRTHASPTDNLRAGLALISERREHHDTGSDSRPAGPGRHP